MEREWEKILTFALDLGKTMLEDGGEVHRVEDTIERICRAYGAQNVEVFSIVSLVTATVSDEDGNHHSQSRRVYSASNNMDRLERLNALSRKICSTLPSPGALSSLLREVVEAKRLSVWWKLPGAFCAAGGFAVFFGGGWLDGLMSALIGTFITWLGIIASNRLSQAGLIAVHSFLSGFITLVFKHIGLVSEPDKVMIGTVMLLIPGIAFGNALREMLKGDTATGILRLSQALILAGIIAVGFALSLVLGRALL